MDSLFSFLYSIPSRLLRALIGAYRYLFSPLVGMQCRFYPSCSAYGLKAIEQHGAALGSALTAWRIIRCNPWCEGGVDEPPPQGTPLSRAFRRQCACPADAPHNS
jgi:putative membrane protein insertion efficiency factor